MLSALMAGVRAWQERRGAMRAMQEQEAGVLVLSDANPLHRARVSLDVGDKDSARHFWEEAKARYPAYVMSSRSTAGIMLDLGLIDEAETLMLQGMRQFPRHAQYAEGYAQVAERRRDFDESIRRWAIMRKKFPSRWTGYVSAAGCWRELGQFDEADKLLAQAMMRFPDNIHALLEWGRVGDARHDPVEALRRWNKFSEQHVAGVTGAARALHEMGRSAEAEERLKAARLGHPTEVAIVVLLAQIAHDQGNLGEAVDRWALVRSRFPLVQTGYVEGARLLRRMQRFDEVEQILTAAMDRFPDAAWIRAEGDSLAADRQRLDTTITNDASPLFDSRSDTEIANPPATPSNLSLPDVFVGLGDQERDLVETTLNSPDDPSKWMPAGEALRRAGALDALDALWSGAPPITRYDAAVISVWASVPRIRQDWPEALRRAREMIDRYPDRAKGRTHLMYALHATVGYAEAMRQVEEWLAQFPDHPDIIGPAADAATAAQDWPTAERLWRALAEVQKLGLGAGQWRCLILSLGGQNKSHEATEVLTQALAMFPDDRFLLDLRSQLAGLIRNPKHHGGEAGA
jgi:tetratricopeptide (TPR) repeat protein